MQQFTELATLREVDRVTGPVCVKSFGKQLADRQSSESARLQNRTKSVDALVLEGGSSERVPQLPRTR